MSYTVAKYLVHRLTRDLGAAHLFGVPGNYTAEFLMVAHGGGLESIMTTNELEAGYAADAYARLRGVGVACTTYGVGSFSLYNAIAGSYVERCPVVLVNGSPQASKAEQLRRQGVLFAHAIDPLRTDELIFRPVTAATAVIEDPEEAPREIDRVLGACMTELRPVYLEVRDRVWLQPCAAPGPWQAATGPADDEDLDMAVEAAAEEVVRRAKEARHPVLWGGELLQRRRLETEFEQLVKATGWSYTTTLLGKGLISENNSQFIGVYDSAFAPAGVKEVVENTDCLIALGTILSDFYGAIVQKHYDRMILASDDAVRVGRSLYPTVPLERFMRRLLEKVSRAVTSQQKPPEGFAELRAERKTHSTAAMSGTADHDRLTWDLFFQRLPAFLAEGKRVLVDTSLALFPSAELPVQDAGGFIAQTAWLSIGYTTGGIVGASFGGGGRWVALTGDGGFQMVPQTLSTLARHKKPAVIFVFNNTLYGIEQYLVDKNYFILNGTQPPNFFNELASGKHVWNYAKLAEAFGAQGFRVETLGQLEKALSAVNELTDVPALVEVVLDRKDLPAEVRATIPAGDGAFAAPTTTVIDPAAFN